MDCPSCRVALQIAERKGIEIDFCPRCRGVWLERGELDKIIERSLTELAGPGKGMSGHDDDSGEYRAYPPRTGDREEYRHERRDDGSGHGKPRRRKSFLGELFDFD